MKEVRKLLSSDIEFIFRIFFALLSNSSLLKQGISYWTWHSYSFTKYEVLMLSLLLTFWSLDDLVKSYEIYLRRDLFPSESDFLVRQEYFYRLPTAIESLFLDLPKSLLSVNIFLLLSIILVLSTSLCLTNLFVCSNYLISLVFILIILSPLLVTLFPSLIYYVSSVFFR